MGVPPSREFNQAPFLLFPHEFLKHFETAILRLPCLDYDVRSLSQARKVLTDRANLSTGTLFNQALFRLRT